MKGKPMVVFAVLSGLLLLGAYTKLVAAERTVELRVLSCRCQYQQVSITAKQMEGVIDADSSSIAGTAKITFDDTKTNLEKIKENFSRAGLPVMGKPKWIK